MYNLNKLLCFSNVFIDNRQQYAQYILYFSILEVMFNFVIDIRYIF